MTLGAADLIHHAVAVGAMLGVAGMAATIGGPRRPAGAGIEGSVALGAGASYLLSPVAASWAYPLILAGLVGAASLAFEGVGRSNARRVAARNDLWIGLGSAVGMAGLLWTESEVAPLSIILASAMTGIALGASSNRSWPNSVRRGLTAPAAALGTVGLVRFGADNGIGVLVGAGVIGAVGALMSRAEGTRRRRAPQTGAGPESDDGADGRAGVQADARSANGAVGLIAAGVGLVIFAGAIGAQPPVMARLWVPPSDANWLGRVVGGYPIVTYVALVGLAGLFAAGRIVPRPVLVMPGPAWAAATAGLLGALAGSGIVLSLGLGWQGSTTTAGFGTVALAVAVITTTVGRPRLLPVMALAWAAMWVMTQTEGPVDTASAAAPIGSAGWPSLLPYVLAAVVVVMTRSLSGSTLPKPAETQQPERSCPTPD